MAGLLRQRRSPSSTIAWLLAILLLPNVGVPLYIIFGGRKVRRLAQPQGTDLSDPGHALRQRGRRRLPSGCWRRMVFHPPGEATASSSCHRAITAYERVVELIERAQSSIHISTYILGSDQGSRDLVERLTRKAAEGRRRPRAHRQLRLLAAQAAVPRSAWSQPAARSLRSCRPQHLSGPGQPEEPPQAGRGRFPRRLDRRHESGVALHRPNGCHWTLARSLGRRRRARRCRPRFALRIGLEVRHRQEIQTTARASNSEPCADGLRIDHGSGRRQRARRRRRPALRSSSRFDLRGADAHLDRHPVLRSGRDAGPGPGPGGPARGRRPPDRARTLQSHLGRSRPRQLSARPAHRRRKGPLLSTRDAARQGRSLRRPPRRDRVGKYGHAQPFLEFRGRPFCTFAKTGRSRGDVGGRTDGRLASPSCPRPGWARELAENIVRLLSPLL